MLIDTHCHLDFPEFDADRDEVIKRAKDAGVGWIINIGSSIKGCTDSIELAHKYEFIRASIGIHPHDVGELNEIAFNDLSGLADDDKVVAIGEVGLDYFKSGVHKDVQKIWFIRFIELAKRKNLPLILHDRDAHQDLFAILKEHIGPTTRGVLHCFSADNQILKEALDIGFFISFTCNITFRNARGLRELARFLPLERLLLETDAPFLAPQEFRGKRNEPAYIKYLVDALAQAKGFSNEDIERATALNTRLLFGIGPQLPGPSIVYKIRNSLYLNITNRCSCECGFCIRNISDYIAGYNLRLENEPTAKEILDAMGDATGYDEVVFCGYGEPTIRLDCMLEVARKLKEKNIYIRLDTNGHGNLINGRSIIQALKGLIDEVSVSLNAHNEATYNRLCRPIFGPATFDKVKEFIIQAKQIIPKVSITCIDMPGVDIVECEKISKELGVGFRKRVYDIVG